VSKNLPNVPGMKLPPMDATEAMRIIANVTSNMSPANPQVLNALRAETVLFAIVAAARELLDVSPRNYAASEKLRKALAGAP
jgi:hypothetical protein